MAKPKKESGVAPTRCVFCSTNGPICFHKRQNGQRLRGSTGCSSGDVEHDVEGREVQDQSSHPQVLQNEEQIKSIIYLVFSRSGQKLFILHMLVLPLIPITALVIQNSVNMSTLQGYQTRVSTIRRQVRIV